MKINIIERHANIEDNEVNVIIETKDKSPHAEDILNYIKQYNKNRKVAVIDENRIKTIEYKDIICFYSHNKINYCKTREKTYKIRSTLNELEKLNTNTGFVRISKRCIANTDHVKMFDRNEAGRLVAKFYDNTEEKVSRRRVKTVLKFIDERRI